LLVEARPTADGGAIVLTRRVVALTGTATDLAAEILLTLAACLVVAAIAAAWLSRRVARPLAATASAARRLASGERGVEVVQPAPTDLARLVAETVSAWQARADALGVRLEAPGTPGSVASADPRRVRQVLDGLVENALRATPAGGTVRIVTGLDPAIASVSV